MKEFRRERLVILLTKEEKQVLIRHAQKEERDIAFIVRRALGKVYPEIKSV